MTQRRLAALALAAAAAYLAGLLFALPGLRMAVKPVPVLCLAVWAAGRGGGYARLIASGLVFSALGDLLLELPGGFLAGLCAFFAAHILYTGAFLTRSRAPHALRALPFAGYGLAVFLFLRPGLGAMSLPVAAYAAAISAMMWRAAACVRPGAAGAPARLAFLGALAFAASDTLIALDRFAFEIAAVRYPIILLYWAGQLGIALSAGPPSAEAATAA